MNRALRRQQVKDREGAAAKSSRAAPRAVPRTGPARPATKDTHRRGPLSWRPQFLIDIISELRKVVWPTRDDVIHLTVVVVIVTVLIGAFLGGIDIGFGWLVDNTLLN